MSRQYQGGAGALHAARAGARALVFPADCAGEAVTVAELPMFATSTLAVVVAHLRGERTLARPHFDAGFGPGTRPSQVASFVVDALIKRHG